MSFETVSPFENQRLINNLMMMIPRSMEADILAMSVPYMGSVDHYFENDELIPQRVIYRGYDFNTYVYGGGLYPVRHVPRDKLMGLSYEMRRFVKDHLSDYSHTRLRLYATAHSGNEVKRDSWPNLDILNMVLSERPDLMALAFEY